MFGHDRTKGDGCDFAAAHMNITTSLEQLSPEVKRDIKAKWKEHQLAAKNRKIKSRRTHNTLRKQLQTLKDSETEED